ncbi:DUF4174 domain-containing protein [Roseovarius sp. SCSIO 43702]|uniref:DUF4174 domain-containing protein n=1 Tax=Roseovarius sp. SCSIO 43702 TaxID=2823043 RepID=UPI001C72CEDD|nr:DUF4174 domain-containing protein [Roseovarius sp. SCSIO 43702]QYX55549.1 DUF4174 domain-containing protein [Roseovarius sp. SCSIO 43702]
MKRGFSMFFGVLMASSVLAADGAAIPGDEVLIGPMDTDLSEFLWKKRPLVVFADSENDPRFIQQMDKVTARLDDLAERDVIVLTDTNAGERTELRDRFHPRGFMIVLLSKDGSIVLRRPAPRDVRELSRSIDKLPLRQQEIRDRRGIGDDERAQ